MSESTIDARLSKGGAVRLTLSAQVANDLKALQGSLRDLAERMGHTSCATGCNPLFIELEREFSVRPRGEFEEQVRSFSKPTPHVKFAPQDPIPAFPVLVPQDITDNLEALQKAVAVAVGKLGCSECCSGFDIAFIRELDMLHINENLEAQGFGGLR